MHVAFDDSRTPKTLLEISRIYNIPNLPFLKSFVREHSFLFQLRIRRRYSEKAVIRYSAPFQLRNFFFDPGRSRHLYSVPWIIGKSWEAVKCAFQVQIPPTYHSLGSAFGLQGFFKLNQYCQISGASLMLSAESIRNGPDDNNLLRFLESLCRIPWHTCLDSSKGANCTLAIAQWVCKTLVS